MRKTLTLAALSCLVLAAAPTTARAEEDDGSVRIGRDLHLSVGYKLWLNTWETVINSIHASEGAHLNAIVKGPVAASIPNLSLKYKRFLLSGSYLTTGDFVFPAYQDRATTVGLEVTDQWTASRTEADVNLGYFVSQNIVLTAGYKSVIQKYTEKYGTTVFPSSKTKYSGGTIGIAGSAAIGHGFSLYGSGAGGLMTVKYVPGGTHTDSAVYEASEVGLAWRAPSFPLSFSLGYKFQYLTTHIDTADYRDQPAADVSRGYIMGLNWVF